MKIFEIETETANIWLGNDGIVRIINLPGSITDFDGAVKNVKATEKFGPKRRPVLVDISEIGSVSREAREYFSSKEGSERTSAMALIIGSPISKVIGNFYYGVNRPYYPIKLFTSEQEAIEWLKKYEVK